MDITLFPTKSNLTLAKNSLKLSRQGYELLDKKRNVLIRELMELTERAKKLRSELDEAFPAAYEAIRAANITMGRANVSRVALCVPVDDSVKVSLSSVMGVEIPHIGAESADGVCRYGVYRTSSALDEAYTAFLKVKELSLELAEVESAVFGLAEGIKKTKKRANALENIMIPKYEQIAKDIQSALEEKEREDFSRLKVIKKMKS